MPSLQTPHDAIACQSMIQVHPYDPSWPLIFANEAKVIQQALGDNGIAIHHVGSTAVPGLAAKPTVDILAVVRCGHHSMQPLEKAGFIYKGEWNVPFRWGFTKRHSDKINLHVYEEAHPDIELYLMFQDHLLSSPDSLAHYARLKTELCAQPNAALKPSGSLFSHYTLGKDTFIRRILHECGYNRQRFIKVSHREEWAAYHRIRQTEIFDPLGIVYDPNHPSITSPTAHHLMLCQGLKPRTVAHLEFLPDNTAALRTLATDALWQSQGYGKHMMRLVEAWLRSHHIEEVKLHARPSAAQFYRALGYGDIQWDNDASIQSESIDLGKKLSSPSAMS